MNQQKPGRFSHPSPKGQESPTPLDPGRIELRFDDNHHLVALYGEYNRHLDLIEQGLDVRLSSRGNQLLIEGAKAKAARDVLVELYQRLRQGRAVDSGDVEGVLRLISQANRPAPGSDEQPVLFADLPANFGPERIVIRKRVLTPRSRGQIGYFQRLKDSPMLFALGPAGTGKTYLAVAQAVTALIEGSVERIILSRPAVEAGENLGFLPGDLREKVDPYLRPLYDALHDLLPIDQIERRFRANEIEIAPLAFMRGRTLANAFIILDEAQNTTVMQMKMFLTRFGENSRMVIAGDPSQIDLPPRAASGLADAVRLLEGVEGVSVVRFGAEDVVRHPLVGRIVDAYARREPMEAEG